MPFVNSTDGTRIFYTSVGAGDPFVLSHGVTHTWQSWENLGYIDALKDEYRVILIDSRGHGESDRPHEPDAYVMPQHVADVIRVLDDLEIESAHFCGHSLGARTGFHLAASHPERLRSLIAYADHPYAVTPMEADVINHVIGILRQGMAGWVEMMDAGDTFAQYRDPAARRELVLSADNDAIIAACIEAARDRGVPGDVSRMSTPCLMLVGEHDDFIDMDTARQATAALPYVDYVQVGGLPHTLSHSDLVMPYMSAFLARVATGAFSSGTG